MPSIKKPVDTSKLKHGGSGTTLMSRQDNTLRGDAKASRVARVTFSTTDEIVGLLEDAAFEKRTSKSRIIEDAVKQYLGL